MLRTFSFQLLLLFLCANLMLPANIVFAAPKDGTVARGQAKIQQSGLKTEINQSSKKAIINWKEFDIAQKESVQHNMPNAGSAALHRVTGGKGASQLAGELKSNGNIFLVNPAGVVIHNGAKINTGGFLATTSDIDNDDFMKGNYAFTKPGHPGASVINKGNITVRDSGFAALVAPSVRNEGVIAAKLGKVALASGDAYKLDTYGDDLINFTVPDKVVDTLYSTDGTQLGASNTGSIKAEGGVVLLTASQLDGIVGAAVNNGGSISASSAELKGGKIVFRGEGTNVDVVNTGEVTASSEKGDGGTIRMVADSKVTVSGKVEAKGSKKGGTVDVSGKKETVIKATAIHASGEEKGLVRLGGEFQGGRNLGIADAQMNEKFVGRHDEQETLAPTAKLTIDSASKISAGSDGTLIVWSEGNTDIDGSLHGRFLETSGMYLSVNYNPRLSQNSIWLIDPSNVVISNSGDANISSNHINSEWFSSYLGENLTGQYDSLYVTASDTITIADSFVFPQNSQGELFFRATNKIAISDDVSIRTSNDIYDENYYMALTFSANDINLGNNVNIIASRLNIENSGSYSRAVPADNIFINKNFTANIASYFAINAYNVYIDSGAKIKSNNFRIHGDSNVISQNGLCEQIIWNNDAIIESNITQLAAKKIKLHDVFFENSVELVANHIDGNITSKDILLGVLGKDLSNDNKLFLGGDHSRTSPLINASSVYFFGGEYQLTPFSIKVTDSVSWEHNTYLPSAYLEGTSGTDPHIFGLSTGPIPDWSFPTVRVEYPLVEHPLYFVWISGATNSQAFSFDSNGIIQYSDTSVSSININSVWLSDYLDSENSVHIQAEEEIVLRDNLVWFSDNNLTLTANSITLVDGVQIYNSGQGHLLFQAGQSPKDLRIGANAYILSGSRHHQGFERTFWGDGTIFEYSASGSSYPALPLTSPTASFATPPSLSVSTDASGLYIGNNVTHKNVYIDGNDTIQEDYVVIGDNFSITADILEFNIQNMQVGNNARITSNKLTIDARLTGGSLLFGDGAFINSFAMAVSDGFDSLTFGKNTTLAANQLDLRADALAIASGSRLFINEYATLNSQELDAAFTLSGTGSFAITTNKIKGHILAPNNRIDLISPASGETSTVGGTRTLPVLDVQSVYFEGKFFLEEFAVKASQNVSWHTNALLRGNAGTNPHIFGLPQNFVASWPFETVRLEYTSQTPEPEEEEPNESEPPVDNEEEDPDDPKPPVDNDEFRRAEFTLYMHLFIRQYVPGYSFQDYDTTLARYVQLIREQAASDVSTGKSTYYDLLASYDYNASMQRILAEMKKNFPEYSLILGVSDYQLFSGTLYMQNYIRAAGRTVDTNWTPTELANAYRSATIWVQNRPIYAILEQLKILDPTYDGLVLEAIKGDYEATRARMLAVVQEYRNNPSWGTDDNFELKRAYDNAVGNMSPVILYWLKVNEASINAGNIVSFYRQALRTKADYEAKLAAEEEERKHLEEAEEVRKEASEESDQYDKIDKEVATDSTDNTSKNDTYESPENYTNKINSIIKTNSDGYISQAYASEVLPIAEYASAAYGPSATYTGGGVLLKYVNFPSGFQASAYYDFTLNKIIIAYAGTNDYADVVTDIFDVTMGLITSDQWKEAFQFFNEVLADSQFFPYLIDYHAEVVVTGHSLGGALAQLIGSVTRCQTFAFNPAPVPPSLVGQLPDTLPNFYDLPGWVRVATALYVGDIGARTKNTATRDPNNKTNIHVIRSSGDPVSMEIMGDSPTASSHLTRDITNVSMPTGNGYVDFSHHGIDGLIDALAVSAGKEIKKTLKNSEFQR